ncbi:MAG: hypothetical protein WDZ73_01065 [Candidatus Paceibacterota bacterium]
MENLEKKFFDVNRVSKQVGFLIGLLCLGAFLFIFINIQKENKKIRIAVCPTVSEVAKEIDNDKYEIVNTVSTSESLSLIKSSKVDIILSGRKLKPQEPQMDYLVLSEGYSFLSKKGDTLFIDQLKKHNLYTDLDEKIIKDNFPFDNINYVDNVYQYLDNGIIITTWDNTDYSKAEIVHVFESNGDRFKLSRRPTIYYLKNFETEAFEIVALLNQGIR